MIDGTEPRLYALPYTGSQPESPELAAGRCGIEQTPANRWVILRARRRVCASFGATCGAPSDGISNGRPARNHGVPARLELPRTLHPMTLTALLQRHGSGYSANSCARACSPGLCEPGPILSSFASHASPPSSGLKTVGMETLRAAASSPLKMRQIASRSQ
jgi:hypothetical protein